MNILNIDETELNIKLGEILDEADAFVKKQNKNKEYTQQELEDLRWEYQSDETNDFVPPPYKDPFPEGYDDYLVKKDRLILLKREFNTIATQQELYGADEVEIYVKKKINTLKKTISENELTLENFAKLKMYEWVLDKIFDIIIAKHSIPLNIDNLECKIDPQLKKKFNQSYVENVIRKKSEIVAPNNIKIIEEFVQIVEKIKSDKGKESQELSKNINKLESKKTHGRTLIKNQRNIDLIQYYLNERRNNETIINAKKNTIKHHKISKKTFERAIKENTDNINKTEFAGDFKATSKNEKNR